MEPEELTQVNVNVVLPRASKVTGSLPLLPLLPDQPLDAVQELASLADQTTFTSLPTSTEALEADRDMLGTGTEELDPPPQEANRIVALIIFIMRIAIEGS